MTEANARVLRPHRKYLPTPEWFRFRSRMAQLNAYLVGMFRRRWQARNDGSYKPLNGRKDILDRIMDAIAESGELWKRRSSTRMHVYCSASVPLLSYRSYGACMCPKSASPVCLSRCPRVRAFFQPASLMCMHTAARCPGPTFIPGACTPAPLAARTHAGTKWDTALETQLCYEVKTFLLAGHETSAAMLTWSTFELSKAPAARAQVGAAALCIQRRPWQPCMHAP